MQTQIRQTGAEIIKEIMIMEAYRQVGIRTGSKWDGGDRSLLHEGQCTVC